LVDIMAAILLCPLLSAPLALAQHFGQQDLKRL
jgi:hypothetical protein